MCGKRPQDGYIESYREYSTDIVHFHHWPLNYLIQAWCWLKWEYLNYRASIWYDPDTHVDGEIVKRPD